MAETATAERTNKVSVSDAGPSAKKVSIEVPAAVVSERLATSMESLSNEAALPGFRKGRVPRWLIEKRFGAAMKKEAKTELASSALQEAIREHKLNVVGAPDAGNLDAAVLEVGKPFAFEVEVEVLPEFTLPSLDGVEVKRPTLEVTDEMVSEEIRKIAINEGTLESRESAEAGDYLTGHAVMVDAKGTEFYNLHGAVVQKPTGDKGGKGMILGIMVDDFDKQLGSPKAGATVTVKAKGPEQHEVEGIRNADLTITFEVERVDRILPAPTEQVVGLFGVEDEAKLREVVKSRMAQRVEVQQRSAMYQQVANYLVDKTAMELPKRLTTQQAARTLERRRLELMYRGIDPQKIEEHMAELRAASGQAAARELKLFFIMHRAAEELKVGVNEGEINQRIAMMAFQRGMRPEQLRADLIRTNQVSGIYTQIRDHKTFDAIIGKAKIADVPAADYDKLMKESAPA